MENQSAAKRREGDGVCSGSDRISRLPDSVLHHILCFLSHKKAVQTCVLSKSWRHLGPTRPVIDFRRNCDCFHAMETNSCENCFYGNQETFIPALDKTFQRYHRQNLFPQELRLHIFELDSQSISMLQQWIQIFINKPTVTTFRLSFGNGWYFNMPSVVFKAESLENLYLHRCFITSIDNVALKNLKRLSLSHVVMDDEALIKIMSGCPFVEYAKLDCCRGLKAVISIGNHENQYLKDFKFITCCYSNNIELDVVEIDVPTLQSIHIEFFSFRKLKTNNYFPHLKSFFLSKVQLSTEFFENFSWNFPLLQEFTLSCCRGFEEIKLFSHSLEHLNIELRSSVKVDINVPNILRFNFSGRFLPTKISFTTSSREWKSQITLNNRRFVYDDALSLFFELNEMVKALSQSQISLDVSECMFYKSKQIECGINNDPVAVELLNISGSHRLLDFSVIPCLFYTLFQIFRPRYITAPNALRSPRYIDGMPGSPTGGVPQCIWEVLITERKNKEYYWQQHLEEVSIEAYDFGEKVWHHVQGKCLPECGSDHQTIRFGLKWRD